MDQAKRVNVLRDWAAGRFRQPAPQNGKVKPVLPKKTVYKPCEGIECHCCDFMGLTVEPGSVDAVVTDIPYEEKWVRSMGRPFSEWCARVLRPGGVMVTWFKHSQLDQCLAALSSHLRYQWLFVSPLAGAKTVQGQWVITKHQIAVVYTRSKKLELRAAVEDWVPMGRKSARRHRHQKNVAQMLHLVEAFSAEEGLVVDPFAGSFTTAEACWHTNRHFIGGDIDPACLGMARERFRTLLDETAPTTARRK